MTKGQSLKYGVIGAGVMGKHHARILSRLSGVKLVGIAEPDPEQAKSLPDIYRPIVFKDYKELLPEAEAFSLASPTSTHFEIGMECLNAGKHLLIEKPLAQTSEQAKILVETAKTKGVVLAVGLIERFNPAFQELCKLIKKERIIGIDLKRFSPFPERITDANVIQDMMTHDLDLLVHILAKDEIEALKAEGKKIKTDKFDTVSATFYFKSGIIAKVSADRVFGLKTRKIVATSERALIEADLLNKKVYIRNLEHPLPSVHHTKDLDQLTEELKDFIKAIKTGAKPTADGEDGFKAIALGEEVEKACS